VDDQSPSDADDRPPGPAHSWTSSCAEHGVQTDHLAQDPEHALPDPEFLQTDAREARRCRCLPRGSTRDRRDGQPRGRGPTGLADAGQEMGRLGAHSRRHAPDGDPGRAGRGHQGQLHRRVEATGRLRAAERDPNLRRDTRRRRRAPWRRAGAPARDRCSRK
jgi:hypothetical protein